MLEQLEDRPLQYFAAVAVAVFIGFNVSCSMSFDQVSCNAMQTIIMSAVVGMFALFSLQIPAEKPYQLPVRIIMLTIVVHGVTGLDWNWFLYAQSPVVGFALSVALGGVMFYDDKIDAKGAIGGIVAATIIYTALGHRGFAMLTLFIAIAVWSTTLAHRYALANGNKLRVEGAKRGLGNLLANTGPAVGFAIAILVSEDPFIFTIGFCACLGTALSDTVSSELGFIYGKNPVDVQTFMPTAIGENGAITAQGTAIGLTAAMVIGVFAQGMELTTYPGGVAVVTGSFAGCMIDSLLGSVYENKGKMTNNAVNAWSGLAGGMAGAYIGLFL